jgi:hypothetical protein
MERRLPGRETAQSSPTTLLRSVPMPVISTSHTSPTFMFRGEPPAAEGDSSCSPWAGGVILQLL